MVEWEEVNGYLEGYGNDAPNERKETTMKTYGQDVTDLLIFASDLVVDCNNPELVQMSTHIGQVSYLTPEDVLALNKQLALWLAERKKRKEE